jgi:DNA-binding NarL/FixJ family response regulator
MKPTIIKIVIADDHEIFREGLKVMLAKHAEHLIQLVGEASNGKELLHCVQTSRPDVVITDIKMPIMDGMEASKQISEKFPFVGIIALSSYNENNLVYDMLQAGAKGYLLKNTHKNEMIEAIITVNKGEMYYCSSTSHSLIKLIGHSRYNPYKKQPQISFCDNEIAMIKLICKQLTTKEIAYELHLSDRTVEEYSRRIKEKIDAKNLVGIALFALKNNIVSLEEI